MSKLKLGNVVADKLMHKVCYRKTNVFFGDSITAGSLAVNGDNNGWVYQLTRKLNAKYINEGVGGMLMQGFATKYGDIPTYDADIHGGIFLAFGVNDVTHYVYPPNDATPSNFQTSQAEGIDELVSKGWPLKSIFVLSCWYLNKDDGPELEVPNYVEYTRVICETKGVVFIDVYTEESIDPDRVTYFAPDGVHPVDIGHKVRAERLSRH